MRKKIVAGNWKMNKLHTEAIDLVHQIAKLNYDTNTNLIIIPPFLYITQTAQMLKNTAISVGAQNCATHKQGAFTGEISAEMLKNVGCKYILIGHSERRNYYNENSQILIKKLDQTLSNKMTPIFCCGEQLENRKKNKHFKVIENQITTGLFHLNSQQLLNCIIAYEPVWAIGTGVTASSNQAQEMHAFIRKLVTDKYEKKIADSITILYGGSCKPSNAKELFAQPDIDGGLIGGAALNAKDFIAIANSF